MILADAELSIHPDWNHVSDTIQVVKPCAAHRVEVIGKDYGDQHLQNPRLKLWRKTYREIE